MLRLPMAVRPLVDTMLQHLVALVKHCVITRLAPIGYTSAVVDANLRTSSTDNQSSETEEQIVSKFSHLSLQTRGSESEP